VTKEGTRRNSRAVVRTKPASSRAANSGKRLAVASLSPCHPVTLSPGHLAARRRLLAWFAKHQRDLPWRRDRDPYRIWVSEAMLQQTQVATVVPYFERFLAALPTLHSLAQASEQEVLRLWEGLGYYRRARDLHRAARQLVTQQAGRLPDDPEVWRQLPGIGRYMLGAILSQAFDRPLPIVEANSERVLCRLFGQAADPRKGPTRRWLWQVAESILPRQRVGEFNQALMELGALICTPAAPQCGSCPLAAACVTRQLGLQDQIPARGSRPEVVAVRESAVVVCRGPRVLLVQRPPHGRWAGMWEFPHGELAPGDSHERTALRLAEEAGLTVDLRAELETIRHGVTHHRITMVCFEAQHCAGAFRSSFYQKCRWLLPAELQDYPVSAPQRRLARLLLADGKQQRLF
jgi:A/G-specific adenine glycosylase